jgi:hypothetical protein
VVLTAAEVLPFLMHDEAFVRELAAERLARDPGPATVSHALAAYDLHPDGPFSPLIGLVSKLPASPACVREMVRRLTGDASEEIAETFPEALAHLRQLETLKMVGPELVGDERLNGDLRKEVAEQLKLLDMPPEELWGDLLTMAADQDRVFGIGDEGDEGDEGEEGEEGEDEEEDDDLLVDREPYGIILALTQHPQFTAGKVREILQDDSIQDTRAVYAAHLAGLLKLEGTIDALIARVFTDDDYLREGAEAALRGIGTRAVVEKIEAAYPGGDEDFQISAGFLLADICSPESEAAMLRLLRKETSESQRTLYAGALCRLGSTEGMAIVEEMARKGDYDRMMRHLDEDFLAASIMLNRPSAYLDEIDNRVKTMRREEKRRAAELFAGVESEPLEEDFGTPRGVEQPYRREVKVGRNDPCPCGSGKKFKKCCGK